MKDMADLLQKIYKNKKNSMKIAVFYCIFMG